MVVDGGRILRLRIFNAPLRMTGVFVTLSFRAERSGVEESVDPSVTMASIAIVTAPLRGESRGVPGTGNPLPVGGGALDAP